MTSIRELHSREVQVQMSAGGETRLAAALVLLVDRGVEMKDILIQWSEGRQTQRIVAYLAEHGGVEPEGTIASHTPEQYKKPVVRPAQPASTVSRDPFRATTPALAGA